MFRKPTEVHKIAKPPIKHYRNESLHLKDPMLSMKSVKLFVPEDKKAEEKTQGCFAFMRRSR